MGVASDRVASSNFFVLTDIFDLKELAFGLGGRGGGEGITVSWIRCAIFKLHNVSNCLLSHYHWQVSVDVGVVHRMVYANPEGQSMASLRCDLAPIVLVSDALGKATTVLLVEAYVESWV